ncbi:GntR family transcriptional regulator [Gilliamella sp. B3464]|uniref:GntR family transcriptional regulator n=1 Tax=unclassified Gilliamella TaxID=2685620 RepID=UPI00226A9286|nr:MULTISPECIES: GntR family transcriptional regulator [unclassified Gilliamella]MCX8712383.1 GntR family transcriptional regulator [Gilliamella sp. B3468]MCX8727014.1 GntR family transcriptional regulator [Gilliamella sp. B2838]MCX8751071.1 GntR family transcriptional regulator [Gilliamella sp. B3464]
MSNNLISNLNRLLDKSIKLPLYQQIVEIIVKLITSGTLKKGDFLPSEREFTQQLNISRITIRKALEILENNGFIIRARGYGTYVNGSFEYSLKSLKGFSEQIQILGQKPNTIWVNKQLSNVSPEIARYLGVDLNEDVFILKRIRYIDDYPVSIEQSYVPKALIDNIDDVQTSLYTFFQTHNIIPMHVKNWVCASAPNEEFMQVMSVEKSEPVLIIKQQVFDENYIPIEYSICHCRSDLYVFTTEE